jgi:hypothetical protein
MATFEFPIVLGIAFFIIQCFLVYRSGYYTGLDEGFRKALFLMEKAELEVLAERVQGEKNGE